MSPLFSIIVVCLNPGDKLAVTLKSIEEQTFRNFEVLIKDGLSTDGSLHYAKDLALRWEREQKVDVVPSSCLKLIEKEDTGIYDAMNQAVAEAQGSYVYFLNSGDFFYSADVLQQLADVISAQAKEQSNGAIYYGNIFERKTGQKVVSNPQMDAFGCYRNVPCHQACFYPRTLLNGHPFVLRYKVRADYEHFLWCFLKERADAVYCELMITDYEGGGYSETKANRKVSAAEHKEIAKLYFSGVQIIKFKLLLWITLAPLRTYIASNKKTAGIYNRFKGLLYGKK